jgi:hypothetical protein
LGPSPKSAVPASKICAMPGCCKRARASGLVLEAAQRAGGHLSRRMILSADRAAREVLVGEVHDAHPALAEDIANRERTDAHRARIREPAPAAQHLELGAPQAEISLRKLDATSSWARSASTS